MVDDAVDEAADAIQADRALGEIRASLSAPTGQSSGLIEAFTEVAHRTGIELEWVEDLMSGVGSDVGAVRIQDDDELMRYCYRVAGTVGLMMCRVMKVREPGALQYAVDLGIAMQLTNICRDVLEDAKKDRVYLPNTRLLQAGVDQQQLLDGRANSHAVSRVVLDLLQLADGYYRGADTGISLISPRARLAIYVASRLYRAIGLRIITHLRGDPLAGRAFVPWYGKMYWLTVAWVAWVGSLISSQGIFAMIRRA
jgi:phytoene synthase